MAPPQVPRPPENRRRKGFTLIELMVVMIVIGIATAVILPEMRGTFEESLLRSTARQLISVLDLASSQAVTANQKHRVRFDLAEGRYAIERRAAKQEKSSGFIPVRDVPQGEGELDKRIRIELQRPDVPPESATPVAPEEDRTGMAPEIVNFYPDGTADPIDLLLQDREGFRLLLRINSTTGKVRIVPVPDE